MKFLRLATVTALSVTVLSSGTTVMAQEVGGIQRNDTDANVIFSAVDEDGNGVDTEVINPEEGPDVEIEPLPGPDGEPNTGPLTIAYVPTMDFGKQLISNQDEEYAMIAETQPLRETGEEVPYISFAQVQDTRGTNEGWDLRVTLSEFVNESAQNNTLHGVEIELLAPRLVYVGNEGNEPVIHQDGLKIMAGGSAVSLISADQSKGSGTSSVIWGDQAAIDESEDAIIRNEAIRLHIPGSTAKDAVEYKASLSWELIQTPGSIGENM